MDDLERDQQEPFSPVKVLIVGSLMLVLGLGLVSYPAYRILSPGDHSGAGTLEHARAFTCSGCTPAQGKLDDDAPTAAVRPAPKGTGTGADPAGASPRTVTSLTPTEASTTPTPPGATASASGAPATVTTAPAATTSPPATSAASAPPAPESTAPASTAPPTAPTTTAPAPQPTEPQPTEPQPTEPQPGRRLGQLLDLLRDLLKGK